MKKPKIKPLTLRGVLSNKPKQIEKHEQHFALCIYLYPLVYINFLNIASKIIRRFTRSHKFTQLNHLFIG